MNGLFSVGEGRLRLQDLHIYYSPIGLHRIELCRDYAG
jgi:hypothetical protein